MLLNYTKEKIREKYESKLKEKQYALQKWNEVKYLYKKDGTPFANLKKAFEGCDYGFDRYDDKKKHPKLSIWISSSYGGYYDTVNCYYIETNGIDRFRTMSEIITAVEKHKVKLEEEVKKYQTRLDNFDEIFEELNNALQAVRDVVIKYDLEIFYEFGDYTQSYLKFGDK